MYFDGEPGAIAGVRDPLVGVLLREGKLIYMTNKVCQSWSAIVNNSKLYVCRVQTGFKSASECRSVVCRVVKRSQGQLFMGKVAGKTPF